MKCELKYVKHEYIKSIKMLFSFEGIVIGMVWIAVCLIVFKFFGSIGVTIITAINVCIFLILSYKEGIQYCKNRKLHNDRN